MNCPTTFTPLLPQYRLHWFAWRPLLLGLLLLTGMAGCVEPYVPDVIDAPPNLLVVEGFINADGPTTIRLSRTASLSATATPSPEIKARLVVESEAGGVLFGLSEKAPGVCMSLATTLPADQRYRLRITTQRGTQYASAYVPIKLTLAIDELRWKPENNGVSVLVSTRDDARASQYYRWEFDETWEVRPTYRPILEYNKARDSIMDIRVPFPTICWVSESASRILLTQTTALSQDKVVDFRLQTLPFDDPKLFSRYSLQVRQQALTKEEFNYWQQLRKNTESIGTLFDPQPGQIMGNVVCTDDPTTLALGFVGAHSVTEKRVFIAQSELPKGWGLRSGDEQCLPPDTVFFIPRIKPPLPAYKSLIHGAFASGENWPIELVTPPGAKGYTLTKLGCVDCRTRGTDVQPSFW